MKKISLVSFLCCSLTGVIFSPNGHPLPVELVGAQVPPLSLQEQLLAGEWLLEDLGGTGVIDRLQTTLKFDRESRLEGAGGCNRYFASYRLEKNQIEVGAIGATRKACPTAVMNQEIKYLQALEKAYRIRLENEFLFIYCQGMDKPLKFTRLQAPEL